MEKLYTVNKNKMGADCGSDQELLIVKFKLKLKKLGKTTRPFRYDLNQIPYNYTWRWKWQPTPVLLPGKFHGWRSLVGYSPWGCKESDMTERLYYDYTVEVRNRFKGLELIDIVPDELWTEIHDIVQETGIKIIPKKKKCKKSKIAS